MNIYSVSILLVLYLAIAVLLVKGMALIAKHEHKTGQILMAIAIACNFAILLYLAIADF